MSKIFFTDLDGTLLNDAKEISPGNQRAVNLALQQGHRIVIATGRPLASAIIQAERLGLIREGCFVIAFNGGEIYDVFRKQVLYRNSLSRELATSVFEEAHQLGIYIQTFSDKEVLAEKECPQLHDYVRRTLQPFRIVSSVFDALEEDPCKLLAIEEHHHDVIVQFQQELLQKYGDILDCYFSNDAYLEIVPAGVTKGDAVLRLCEYLDIPVENTVAAGDAPNDVEMIRAAQIGAVMCNAFPGVKQYADYITLADNNHDGAAEIISKFILGSLN
ncbi:MAG: Cof-type HAD-IIB family hydrolase [Clostridiales bacterium]|nr:Cof-type HAD-IIB family hydrolase [Clostridiales bacterium]